MNRAKTDISYVIKHRSGEMIFKIFRLGFFIGIAYLVLFPILAKLSVSFMTKKDMFDMTVQWIPKKFSLKNYNEVNLYLDYWGYFRQTLFVSLTTTLIQMVSCTLAAYGLGRFKFKGRGLLFAIVIFSLVVPPQTYAISTYMQFRFFDFFGLGTLLGIAPISTIGSPLPVFIMSMGCMGLKNGLLIFILRQFFINLPVEVEEAAFIDGAGIFKTFYKVMLPNSVPALATVFVFSFVWSWNNYEDAMLYMPNLKLLTTCMANLTTILSSAMGGAVNVDISQLSLLMSAAGIMCLAPLIVFFLIAQKFFVEGIERTGLTGM